MGILGSLFNILLGAADTVERGMERNADRFGDGYDRGTQRASQMSDAELRSRLKNAKENGVSDWGEAGKVRAMADEYKRRNK